MRVENEPMVLTGKESFTNGGNPVGLTVTDFWSFQYSNIDHDPEYVAEFLVAKALGKSVRDNGQSWTLYDIDYDGLRVEGKETSWWHPFNEPGKLSLRRSFGIAAPRSVGERQCDVYVFCLLTGEDRASACPLELKHWKFYVVARSVIDESFGDQKTVSLSRVQEIAKEVDWEHIREQVDALRPLVG